MAAGTSRAQVTAPVAEVVTVAGAVVTAAPSNLMVRMVLIANPSPVTMFKVTEAPTGAAPGAGGLVNAACALAGAAVIATRGHTTTRTNSNLIRIKGFFTI